MKHIKSDGYNSTFGPDYAIQENPALIGFDSYGAGSGIEKLYANDDLARRIVDVVPEEMVAPGFKISGVEDNPEFESLWTGLSIDQHITDALCWARLGGKSAIMLMLDDRRLLSAPATEGAKIEAVRVYGADEFRVSSWEKNQRSPRYGLPSVYVVKPASGNQREFKVHYTRFHVTEGGRLPTSMAEQTGERVGASVLSRSVVSAIIDYNRCHDLTTQLLKRKQQTVWKAKGLAALCDDDEGVFAARLRLAQVKDNSGVDKPVGIDATDEDYMVLNSDISGVPEFMQMKIDRLVTLTGIHEIILLGKNPSGVSASPNTALQTFYKMIDRKRKDDLQPILEFILPFVLDEKEWAIKFNPLAVPSESERADILSKVSEAVDKLIGNQTMEVEEARDTLDAMNLGIVLKANPGNLPTREDVQKAKQQQEEADRINSEEKDESQQDD